jgi:hypothetical protein
LRKEYKDNRSIEEIRGEVNEKLKEKLIMIQKDVQEKEECLVKVFNEKEDILGKYESLRLSIEDEVRTIQGKAEIQERVAKNIKLENQSKSD